GAWEWRRLSAEPASRWVTAPVTAGDIEDTVTALGNLQPKNYVDVGAQVSGQLTRIDVAVGDKVKQGDLLAEIDPVVAEATLKSNRAQLAALQAQAKEAQSTLDADQANLGFTKIYAPMAGTVVSLS